MGEYKSRTRTRGSILPFIAIGAVVIFGMAGLALDMGHSYLNKSRLQSALDAAALSGAKTLFDTRDMVTATQHATDAFNQHLQGEMAADQMALIIEYSPSITPFNPSATPPYVRATVNDFDRTYSFARLLPFVGVNKVIAASAVAGPLPLGGPQSQVCDIAPILVCGDGTDTDSSDGTLFGIGFDDGTSVGPANQYCLKASRPPGGNGNGNGNGNSGVDWPDDCANETLHETGVDTDVGPGNFQLLQLSCGPGGNCVRHALAGAENSCLTTTDTVTTEPGNTVGPTAQGFNTRFGVYQGAGLNAGTYPPDRITTEGISYNDYLNRQENGPYDEPTGVDGRRVLAVPIGDCGADTVGPGRTNVPVMGLGCFFLTEPTENNGQNNWIKGRLVEDCLASGRPGPNPDLGVANGSAPAIIVLFKDSANLSS